jgi:hypothetical protein
MDRVNIYLPKELRQQIQLQASRSGQPQAAVIRELLEEGLRLKRPDAGEALLRLASLGFKGGPPDFATNLDDYLYGDKS